jgi:hypothetical protein
MSAVTKLPDITFVARHFQDLVGRKCSAILTKPPLRTGPTDTTYIAWYELEDHRIVAVMAVDHGLASILGTALAMVPPAQAQALTKAGTLDSNATECLFECLNVSSRFFHRAFEKPVTILQVARSNGKGAAAVPDEARAVFAAAGQRLDIALTVDGYGTGNLCIACL